MFAKCPAGRPGTADEVENVAELIMSEKGAFITGSDFLIDGGTTASYYYGKLKPETKEQNMSLFGNKKEDYKNKKSLVIYFSRGDENYAVGYIEKGNTEIVAEYIRDIIEADLFKIEGVKGYSANYQECIEEAKERQQRNERPELKRQIEDILQYEVIYIGAPVILGNNVTRNDNTI